MMKETTQQIVLKMLKLRPNFYVKSKFITLSLPQNPLFRQATSFKQLIVDENPFSLMLNWTQHPPPAQNREVESFVVELSTDGGTTFKVVCLINSDLCQSLYVFTGSLLHFLVFLLPLSYPSPFLHSSSSLCFLS